uniref:Alpha-tubulin N-acetyltransferase n=1 Tax=Macrostomum lignano TaxID=282301 RepID=A0A1I8HE23_9PLAT
MAGSACGDAPSGWGCCWRSATSCANWDAFPGSPASSATSSAQALPNAITSFKRLQYSDHRLYVLKDAFANNMQGAVVGILKMGRKKLFVYDMLGKQHEMEPLCVLDFYVHESRQRHGYGKVLFEYMLQQEQVEPVHLAIDRPSPKFAGFLKKHYGLKDCIPQMNKLCGVPRLLPRQTRVRCGSPRSERRQTGPSAGASAVADKKTTGAPGTGAFRTGAPGTGAFRTGAFGAGAPGTGACVTEAIETRAIETRAIETRAIETRAIETRAIETGAVESGTIGPAELHPVLLRAPRLLARRCGWSVVDGRIVHALHVGLVYGAQVLPGAHKLVPVVAVGQVSKLANHGWRVAEHRQRRGPHVDARVRDSRRWLVVVGDLHPAEQVRPGAASTDLPSETLSAPRNIMQAARNGLFLAAILTNRFSSDSASATWEKTTGEFFCFAFLKQNLKILFDSSNLLKAAFFQHLLFYRYQVLLLPIRRCTEPVDEARVGDQIGGDVGQSGVLLAAEPEAGGQRADELGAEPIGPMTPLDSGSQACRQATAVAGLRLPPHRLRHLWQDGPTNRVPAHGVVARRALLVRDEAVRREQLPAPCRTSSITVGSVSHMTARGVNRLPLRLNADSAVSLAQAFHGPARPSAWTPCSRQYSSQTAWPSWQPACPMCTLTVCGRPLTLPSMSVRPSVWPAGSQREFCNRGGWSGGVSKRQQPQLWVRAASPSSSESELLAVYGQKGRKAESKNFDIALTLGTKLCEGAVIDTLYAQ